MSRISTDICIIGAGAGGLSVAAGAAQMGARTVLIEAGRMGGDCLNTGCVPSKALLHAARAGMSWEAAHAHIRATIAAIAPNDSQQRFEALGVRVIRAQARFASPREVTAGGMRIRARRFVIATGARPAVPPTEGLDQVDYLTSETIFDLAHRPDHLLILGAGPVGLEMAEAHRALGARVTVIEAARALSHDDPELAAHVTAALRARGIAIHEQTPVTRVTSGPEGITLHTAAGSFGGSHLLVATGRRPVTEGLNLPAAGIEATPAGIRVNARLRTTNRRAYAIGDVTGGPQFTHVAGYHAGVIIRPMLFALPARARSDHIPRVTYTSPELAQVGLNEQQARARHGARLTVLRAGFADNDRAIAGDQAAGLAKVMVVAGRPVGAAIVGPQAGELIAPWALAMANRLRMSQIAAMIAPYPTLGEINKRLAGSYFTPRLFDNPRVKRIVGLVQKLIP